VLLPFVALVELAIVMVAPKRFLDGPATVRILLGAATTLALFSTAHPLVLIVAWVVTALPTWWSTRATPGGQTAARVYAIMMTLAVACMASGTLMMIADPPWEAGGGAVGACGGWLVAQGSAGVDDSGDNRARIGSIGRNRRCGHGRPSRQRCRLEVVASSHVWADVGPSDWELSLG
jgi:hypothetical protein